MQQGEEPWTKISKWVVVNEGIPAQDTSFETFSLQLLSLNNAHRSQEYNHSAECADRFEWYKRWLFEMHRIIKSKLNEDSAKNLLLLFRLRTPTQIKSQTHVSPLLNH